MASSKRRSPARTWPKLRGTDGVRGIGVEFDGASNEIDGGFFPPQLEGKNAQLMQSVGVVGLLNEDLGVQRFGFGDLAGAVKLRSAVEDFVQIDVLRHGISCPLDDVGIIAFGTNDATWRDRRARHFLQNACRPSGASG